MFEIINHIIRRNRIYFQGAIERWALQQHAANPHLIIQRWALQKHAANPHLIIQRSPPENHTLFLWPGGSRSPDIPQYPAIAHGPLGGEELTAACEEAGGEWVVLEGLQSGAVHLRDAIRSSVHQTAGSRESGMWGRPGHIYWTTSG